MIEKEKIYLVTESVHDCGCDVTVYIYKDKVQAYNSIKNVMFPGKWAVIELNFDDKE